MSKEYARRWEAKRLSSYRSFTGRNPLYNYMDDSGFDADGAAG